MPRHSADKAVLGAGPPVVKTALDDQAPDATTPRNRQETLLDEAIEETFPASDPISPMIVR